MAVLSNKMRSCVFASLRNLNLKSIGTKIWISKGIIAIILMVAVIRMKVINTSMGVIDKTIIEGKTTT